MKNSITREWCPFICKGFLLVTLFLWSVALTLPANAAINQQIDFYGNLQNDSGINLAGSYDMMFRFYDARLIEASPRRSQRLGEASLDQSFKFIF